MNSDKKALPHRMRKASRRVLLGETREEEAARLEKEIAAHPVIGAKLASIALPRLGRVGVASRSFRFQNGQSLRGSRRR
jgi:hypothetical protein